jgi:N utilization substance protein B
VKKQFRTIIREHVFKMIYQYELLGDSYNTVPKTYWLSEEENNKNVVNEANELFLNIAKNKDLLDNLYKDKLKDGWTFERIGIIEKCILRAALYELLNTKTPIYAINNDYGQIAKNYTDDKIASFIRGIIAAVEEEEKVKNK